MATIYKTKQFQDIYDGKIQDGFGLTGYLRKGINVAKITDVQLDEFGDVLLYSIVIPSNSLLVDILMLNDRLDVGGDTFKVSFGLWALGKFTSVTNQVETEHDDLSEIDGNILVDETILLQSKHSSWIRVTPNATKSGTDNRSKRLWQLLGYEKDPGADFIVGMKVITISGNPPATGYLALRVDFVN